MSPAAVRRAALTVALAAVPGMPPTAWAQDYAREARWEAEVRTNLVVGDAIRLKHGSREFLGLYTSVPNAVQGIVLVHGIGVHPDHGVIGVLRSALADLGYTTLSIQMPVQASDAAPETYTPAVMAEAAGRIGAAGRWLRAQGLARVVLLSHSMGARMSREFWRGTGEAPYAAWICMGLSGDLAGAVRVPVLDVRGEHDLRGVLDAAVARGGAIAATPGSRQVVIPAADHFYTGREQPLVAAIDAFLRERPDGAR